MLHKLYFDAYRKSLKAVLRISLAIFKAKYYLMHNWFCECSIKIVHLCK